MLKFSGRQFNAGEETARDRFHEDLHLVILEECETPKGVVSAAEMRQFTEECERRCKDAGVLSDASISEFAVLSYSLGIYVDDIPEVYDLLRTPEVEPEARTGLLLAQIERLLG